MASVERGQRDRLPAPCCSRALTSHFPLIGSCASELDEQRELQIVTKILIAVDETEHSTRAARAAHSIFGDNADYLVINVSGVDSTGWGGGPMLWGVAYPAIVPGAAAAGPYPLVVNSDGTGDTPGADAAERAEQVAESIAAAADIPAATPLGDVGDPVPAILKAADAHEVDVIVVGASHTGWFARLIARPVADNVLKGSDRPVLVVP